MKKIMFIHNKTSFLLAGLFLLNVLVLGWGLLDVLPWKHDRKMIRTTEPLLIEGPQGDKQVYVLPPGTTLYHDKSFPEGHDRYVVYLNHKGALAHEDVPMKPEYGGALVDPLLLSSMDAEAVKAMLKRSPLSRDDIVDAVKFKEITREDLVDILHSVPE